MEGNKRLSDRRPTALRLVLHITKSQVGMPHMYKFLRGVFFLSSLSKTFPPSPSTPSLPLSSTFPSFMNILYLYTSSLCSHSAAVSVSLARSVSWGAFGCCESSRLLNSSLAEVGHKLNTERKRVGGVHAHAWLLLGSAPAAPSSPLPSVSLEGG